jgi:endonuclease YncB( thermonuclease family)
MKEIQVKKMRHTLVTSVVLALLSATASADTLTGRVVGVSDGDTLTVLDDHRKQHKVRLSGIDSPEKKQPFGQVCKQSLSDLTYDRVVRVEWDKLDRWGRVIGRVVVDGQDVNLVQIRRGCGWHYKKYQNEQPLEDRLAYNAAEATARTSRVGLWASNEPMPPWDWRKARRTK